MPKKILTEDQREKKRTYERAWRKRRYAEDASYRARKKSTDKRSRKKLSDEVGQYKLSKGCSNCGYKRCSRALHFHHHNKDKEFHIADKLASRRARKLIFDEIEKCIILCSNCHSETHCKSRLCKEIHKAL